MRIYTINDQFGNVVKRSQNVRLVVNHCVPAGKEDRSDYREKKPLRSIKLVYSATDAIRVTLYFTWENEDTCVIDDLSLPEAFSIITPSRVAKWGLSSPPAEHDSGILVWTRAKRSKPARQDHDAEAYENDTDDEVLSTLDDL